MTEPTKALAKVFKSRMPFLRMVFDSECEAIFTKHRLVTSDEVLIKKLNKIVETDKNVGIYIDPEDSETSELPPGSNEALKQQQLADFLASKTATLDAGTNAHGASAMGVASSSDVSGKNMQAPHFSASDVKAALLAKATSATKPTN